MCLFKKKEENIKNINLNNDIIPQGELKPIGRVIFCENMFADDIDRLKNEAVSYFIRSF